MTVYIEKVPPFKLDEIYREQPALYCTECMHPVTAFIDRDALYVGCLRKNKKVTGEHWHDWEDTSDMYEPWKQVPSGHWQGVIEYWAETLRVYEGQE